MPFVTESICVELIRAASGLRVKKRHMRAFIRYNTLKKGRNFFRSQFELRQRKVTLTSYPLVLFVEPTNTCNLRCPLCPTGRREYGRPPGFMALGEFKKIIDELGDYLYEVNLFNWGEPLLNKEILAMVDYAHKHNISTCINTNATMLTEDVIKGLIQQKLDHLILSIDGLSPETYSKYRIGGDFGQVIENVRRLTYWKKKLSSPLCVEWQFLIFKHNQHEVGRVAEFAKGLGVDIVTIMNANGSPEWVLEGTERGKYYSETTTGRVCSDLWGVIIINPDGGVSPCCFTHKKEDDFGNFFTEGLSLHHIWNNIKFRQARSIFAKARSASDVDVVCNTCPVAIEFIQAHEKKHGLKDEV